MNTAESIVAVLPGLSQQKGFLGMRVDMYNLLVTPQRLVFVMVSKQRMQEAIAQARAEAKQGGKGFFGQVAAQFGWIDVTLQAYEDRSIDTIINENPGSFSMALGEIRRVKTSTEEDDDSGRTTHEVRIEATGGKYRFKLANRTADQARDILSQVLPGVVK